MWTWLFNLVKGSVTPYVLVGLLIGGGYVWWLDYQLKVMTDERDDARNNVVLISKEFDLLANSHNKLVSDFKDAKDHYEYTVKILKRKHEKDKKDLAHVTKILTEIDNVKPEDDGTVANVVTDTLNALRLLD